MANTVTYPVLPYESFCERKDKLMPTGYTHKLYEGEDQPFDDFVLSCARAFGALILMRDDPPDTPIPDEFKPESSYSEKQLAKANDVLSVARGWSDATAEAAADTDYKHAHYEWEQHLQRTAAMKARYEAMLEKVQAWEPPTPDHQELKEFMDKQLRESIDFDCAGVERWYPEPQRKSGAEHKAAMIVIAERDIEYHTEQIAKEAERAQGRTAWVRALRDSLGQKV